MSEASSSSSGALEGEDTNSRHQAEAAEYLEKHKILKFFESLTAALVYERPDDLKAFARQFIENLQKAKTDPDVVEPPRLIDDSNLESIFGMLDITKKGCISLVQYTKAMENLGVIKFNTKPAGGAFDRINKNTFMMEAKTALRNACTIY